jgi:hypothetical protein
MSVKTRLLAVTGALLVVGIIGAAPTGAATSACGSNCTDFSGALYGPSSAPTFVLADTVDRNGTASVIGRPVTLAAPNNADQGEDFTVEQVGTVSFLISAGFIAPGLSPYDSQSVVQINWSPNGNNSALCLGVAGTPANGSGVVFEDCGVDAGTLWILDTNDQSGGDEPLINGATDSNFSTPFVLSALGPGFPLFTSMMHKTSGGQVFANELWGSNPGPV